MTTLTPITAVIPDFTVTPVINTTTFPEDIDQYNTEIPAVINAQQLATNQINILIPQLNTLEDNVSSLEASTLSAAEIALAVANFKGKWFIGTAYTVPSSVWLAGRFYAAIAPSTGKTPPNVTYWVLIPGIDDTIPALDSSYSGQYTQSLIDNLQTEISNLSSASLGIASSTDPVFAPISTTSTAMPFSITVASTNTAIITASDGSDTMTFLKNGTFNFASVVTIEATSTSTQTVTFDIINTANNAVIGTQTIPVSLAEGRINAYPMNTLMTVGANGVPSSPLTIKIKTKVSGGTGLNLKAYESVLSAQSIVNSQATADSIHAAPVKATPIGADEFSFVDSVGGVWSLVKLSYTQLKATLFESSSLTGTPTAPTAAVGTNTTQLATTAGVIAQIPASLNATGTAPIYACRAWVNFNGTGTVAIRASGNVSSITDNGVGDYTVNFTTAMPDANYSCSVTAGTNGSDANYINTGGLVGDNAISSKRIYTARLSMSGEWYHVPSDQTTVVFQIFR